MPNRLARGAAAAAIVMLALGLTCSTAAADGGSGGEGSHPNPTKVNGAIGVRLLEAPSSRADDPRARIYIVDHVNPGTRFTRRFMVLSTSTQPQHVLLYAAAASLRGGDFTFAPGHTPNELTSWMQLSCAKVTLRPHGHAVITAKVAVPAKATKGERYAVVWAQVSSAKPGPTGNVALVNRVGIRAYLDVGPGGDPPSDFTIGQVLPQRTKDGKPTVVAKVANTGQRALDLTGQLTLYDGPNGISVDRPFRTTKEATLAPGQHGTIEVAVDEGLPDGPWKFKLTLHSGKVKHTVAGKLTFPTKRGAWGLPASLNSPLPLALTVTAGLAVLFLFIIAIRRLRTRPGLRGAA